MSLANQLAREEAERQRAFSEALLQVLGALVVVLDPEGRVIRFNRACQQVTGWSEAEVTGKRFWDVVLLPEEREGVKQVFRALSAGMFPNQYENHWVTRSGERRLIQWNNTCLTNPDGSVSHVIGTGVDVTGKRQAESDARLRKITDQIDGAVLEMRRVSGGPWTLAYASDRLGALLDITVVPGEFGTATLVAAAHPDDRAALAAALAEDKLFIEFRHPTPQGGVRWMLLQAGITQGEGGEPVWTGFIADVSARRAAEERAAATERRFQTTFDKLPLPVTTSNARGERLYANQAYMQVFGYSVAEVPTVAQAIERYVRDPVERARIAERVLAHRSAQRADVLLLPSVLVRSKTGEDRLVDLHVFHEGDTGITMFVDVTLREQAARALEQANARLAATNHELEAFSYSVSHDLRAPLRHIDGFSAALVEDCGDALDEVARSHLARIRAASQRMGQLIDDLLRLSNVTRSEMRMGAVDMSGLAREIAHELQRRIPARAVAWEIQEGVTVEGDEALLQVALENLLDNAWKYTSRKPRARIQFQAERTGQRVLCKVVDDGAGFDPAYADNLFGAFQRLHAQTDYPGTGIGLATAKRVILRHGGTISAEAKVDQGATFMFDLPAIPDPRTS